MSNELMDFTPRDNFEFFKFWENEYTGYKVENVSREELKRHCENVIESAHKTTRDMYELAYALKELKENKTWGYVINPESGYSFANYSFSDFCKYAFGFSQTMTSNFIRIAKFMEEKYDGAVGFIETKYEKFKKSCLIEIAAISADYWRYFTSDMTVADIRLAKDYMVHGRFYIDRFNTDFELMKYAQAYKAEKEAKKAETVAPAPSLDIIPGQISLDDMDEVQEESQAPQAPAKFDVGFSSSSFWEIDDELDEARYDEPSEVEEESEEFEGSVSRETEAYEADEPSRYSFQNRNAIRAFYGDYRNWTKNYMVSFNGMNVYEYALKIRVMVVAVETTTCKDIANLTAGRTVVRYFWREVRAGKMHTYEVSTLDLETHIKEIKDELI